MIDVGVQVEATLLDQLQGGYGGEELADRTKAENGAFRIDRHLVLYVGVAIALAQDQFTVLNQDKGHARDVARGHLFGKEAIHKVFQLGGVDRDPRRSVLGEGRTGAEQQADQDNPPYV